LCLITHRHTTLGGVPLDEGSARRRATWQQTVLTTDRLPCPGDSNPQARQASDRRYRSATGIG